ncbi:MAG TPA: flagellar filament outer layer protein FlaA [Armatimonadota bacterium]|nr:flagellar filament outer layer protein FlaA [Armatimonadota bacterium]
MKLFLLLSFFCIGTITPVWCLTSVMVQNFESSNVILPRVWSANAPQDNWVKISKDMPYEGTQCLKLHYSFANVAGDQYIGITNSISVKAPVHKLHFWVNGDSSMCGTGVQITDASGETHQYRTQKIDFQGWKEVVVDLDSGHETWGGDKNKKLDYPLTSIVFIIHAPAQLPSMGELFFDAISVDSEQRAEQTILTLNKITVQSYESDDSLPKLWGVNTQAENSVKLSQEMPSEGKQCLKLHYAFTAGGNDQYLGLPVTDKMTAPIHKLRVMIDGDNSKCGLGVQVTDASGETHQYRLGSVDFQGWKEMVVDLDGNHETWGGDKNNNLDYPLAKITLIVHAPAKLPATGDLGIDAISVDSERPAEQTLAK